MDVIICPCLNVRLMILIKEADGTEVTHDKSLNREPKVLDFHWEFCMQDFPKKMPKFSDQTTLI